MLIHIKSGFSLVEILVSLFVVSIAAVNISGLQKVVGDQNRDNFAHTAVVELATEKFEEVMELNTIVALDALDDTDTPEIITVGNTSFELLWNIVSVTGAGNNIRTVELNIRWEDAERTEQSFTYSEQISLAMLLGGAGGSNSEWGDTIPNLLDTNKVSFFEANMGYKRDAYVIYNSQLFHSTAVHSVGNGGNNTRDLDPPITYTNGVGTVTDGWENIGRIDNPELASLFAE